MSDTNLHPSQLELSMFVDDALADSELAHVSQHVEHCEQCAATVRLAQQERTFLLDTLQTASDADEQVVIPPFKRPASLKGFAMANIATGLTLWLAQFLWKTIFGELFMNAASWLTSIYIPDTYELISSTTLYYLQEGTAMIDAYIGLVMLTLVTVTVLWALFAYRRHRVLGSLGILLAVTVSGFAPTPAQALEIRTDESIVTISTEESIDDTLIAAGETIIIEGDINGDLIAAGRRIEVEGNVAGNVMAFGENVKIRGNVGGMVLTGASTVDLEDAQVGGNVWAGADKINLDADTRVDSNIVVAGQRAVIQGGNARDLYGFLDLLELDGSVGGKLKFFGNRARLLNGAHVQGDATFHVEGEDKLEQADGARIDGKLEFAELPRDLKPTNEYLTVSFYLWQATKLVSALLVGLALLWLVPGLRTLSVNGGLDGIKTAGIGFITLVSLPVIAMFMGITLIGLPFAIVAIFAWAACWYLAKIAVGIFVGRMLLGGDESDTSNAKLLVVGLAIVIIAINLPFLGGIINFVLTIVGVGLLAQYISRNLSARTV